MDYSTKTSFIPQQPLLKIEGAQRSREPMNFALILALVVFFVTLIVGVGLYVYKLQVERRVANTAIELEEAEKLFSTEEITEYKRVDTRLSTAKILVRKHEIFSAILDFLESGSAQNIGLTSLAYSRDASGRLALSLNGQATSYSAIYFQAQAWRAMKPVEQVDISGMNLDEETGIVGFGATILLDPAYTESARVLDESTSGSDSLIPDTAL